MTQVRDLVRGKDAAVVAIDSAADLATATALLVQHGVGGVAVVAENGKLVGFVSERDIALALHRSAGDVRQLPVSSIMQKPPTCTPDDQFRDVMSRMTRQRLRHLVVVDDGRATGVISVGDIVKHRLEQLETEAGVLRDYVAAQRAV